MNTRTASDTPAELLSRRDYFLGVPLFVDATVKGLGKGRSAIIFLALAILIPTTGIAATPGQMQLSMLPGANANVSDLDFRYSLRGDQSLKPLRVYNNSITTTIEFVKPLGNKLPTLQILGAGKYLNSSIKFFTEPDRLIVDGLFDSAELIYSGPKKGSVTIERLVKTETGSNVQAAKPIVPGPLRTQSPTQGRGGVVQAVSTPPVVQAEAFIGQLSSASTVVSIPAVTGPSVPISLLKPVPPPIPTWTVSPQDKTIREALKNWTGRAGWTFEAEFWTLSIDIPVTASATFSGDFKSAVRQLIAATELSDTPAQPCFYLNRVVRVVPINQVCDQMSAQ